MLKVMIVDTERGVKHELEGEDVVVVARREIPGSDEHQYQQFINGSPSHVMGLIEKVSENLMKMVLKKMFGRDDKDDDDQRLSDKMLS